MYLLYADKNGNIFDNKGLGAAAMSGNRFFGPLEVDWIPLPEGSQLVLIPESGAIGYSEDVKDFINSKELAVAALLPAGYTRTFLPAYKREKDSPLPLFGYTAVGWEKGNIYVAAIQTDDPRKWAPKNYNSPSLYKRVERLKKAFPNNPLVKHLGKCSLEYHCFTAQNIFYNRWEGGIPASPTCNAGCIGCISLQESECCPSPQDRIDFVPSVEDIASLGIYHLGKGIEPIISFGQGCEGEPSVQWELISNAIREIRKRTVRGLININTNGGITHGLQSIVDSGLDTMRVSLISADEEAYNSYTRPKGYSLKNVKETIRYGVKKGVFVSLNLLTLPGLTDIPGQAESLIELIKDTGVNMIQFRNLNIDCKLMEPYMVRNEEPMGIRTMMEYLQRELPQLKLGSFTRYR